MKLKLIGSEHEYSLIQSALTLFPDESDDSTATCTVTCDEVKVTAVSEISLASGKSAVKKCSIDFTGNRVSDEKKAIKLSFYDAAVEIKGYSESWGALTGVRPAKLARYIMESGLTAEEAEAVLINDYRLSREKASLCMAAGVKAYDIKKKLTKDDACIYIGIPFCPSRCVYCSFISEAAGKNADKKMDAYVEALCREISESASSSLFGRKNIISVYIGGGTPAMLSPEQIILVTDTLRRSYDIPKDIEFTIEAGRPDAITVAKLEAMKEAGATRISVNPQTTDDELLRLIGRRHTAEDIFKTFEDARSVGFDSINMDLIAGLPKKNDSDDGVSSFKRTLDEVIALDPENITVHTLAVKRGSKLHEHMLSLPDKDDVLEMLEYAERELTSRSYSPYYLYRQKYMTGNMENIGWTKTGYDSVYNICMMEELCDIISFGAGGVSKLTDDRNLKRIYNHKYAQEYIDNIDEMIRRKCDC